jgi:hypothetical protein
MQIFHVMAVIAATETTCIQYLRISRAWRISNLHASFRLLATPPPSSRPVKFSTKEGRTVLLSQLLLRDTLYNPPSPSPFPPPPPPAGEKMETFPDVEGIIGSSGERQRERIIISQ